jgi:hypothetical protein
MTMTEVVIFLLMLFFPLLPGRCQAVLNDAMGQVVGVSPHSLWRDAIVRDHPFGDMKPVKVTEGRIFRALAWSRPFDWAYVEMRGWWPTQRRIIRRIDLYYDTEHHVWYHRNREKHP